MRRVDHALAEGVVELAQDPELAEEALDRLDVQDLQAALNKLVAEQREALMLVAVGDLSYEDAAALMQCKVGTVKSRVCRARDKLAELLGYSGGELGADRLTRSVMGHSGAMALDG